MAADINKPLHRYRKYSKTQ